MHPRWLQSDKQQRDEANANPQYCDSEDSNARPDPKGWRHPVEEHASDSAKPIELLRASDDDIDTIAATDNLTIGYYMPYVMVEVSNGICYTSHALITHNTIQIFVLITPQDGLLPTDSAILPLDMALEYTLFGFNQRSLDALIPYLHSRSCSSEDDNPFNDHPVPETLSTHLSLDFTISEDFDGYNGIQKIVTTADPTNHADLTLAYTDPAALLHRSDVCICRPENLMPKGTYSLPRVLVELFYIVQDVVMWRQGSWAALWNLVMGMLLWGLCFKEMWEVRDPVPCIVEYCVGQPIKAMVWMWEVEYFSWMRWIKKALGWMKKGWEG
ncbi:hypothetical protein K469DRAFT_692069 [Zopfia rhizophila CBS 207.26]|uniref:Uncharacterized protein n=1 Tax=Zopfia rhizophila CBS 207.26 TaxID=1314779 RepID=A0A6A6DQ31_9PEZI|nr:hypothetical protein K469DRAFT_692069 [Zopfia rhizophila CBS 207.26]